MYYSGIKMYHKGIKKSYWYQMGTMVSKCVEKVWKVSQKVWNWFFWYEIEFLGIKWVFSYQIEVFDTFSCRFDTKMGIKKTAVFSWWDLYAAYDPRLTFEEWDPAQPVDKSQEPTSMIINSSPLRALGFKLD